MSTAAVTLVDLGQEVAEINGERFEYLCGRIVPYNQWENIGMFCERFQRGALVESLAQQSKMIPLLLWHDHKSLPIGMSEDWDDRPDGLYGRFKIALTPVAQEAARAARDEILTGMSIGYRVQQSTWEPVRDWHPGNLDKVTRTRGKLIEVSLTPTPAFPGARVTDVIAEPLGPQARSHLRRAQAWRRQLQMLNR